MRCPHRQHENRESARFCAACGNSIAWMCPACSQPPPLMPQAYTPQHLAEKTLHSRVALEGERKQVTVFFTDLKGSMELLADGDPEDARL
jgi:hypothetical protein